MAEPALEAIEPADLSDPVILSSGREELERNKKENGKTVEYSCRENLNKCQSVDHIESRKKDL